MLQQEHKECCSLIVDPDSSVEHRLKNVSWKTKRPGEKKKSRLGIIHARLWSRLHSPQGHIFLNPQLPSRGRNMAEESRWPSSSPCTDVWGENGGRERGLLHQPHSCKRRRILHQRWWTAEVSLVEQGEKSGSKREPWMLLSSSTSAAKGS